MVRAKTTIARYLPSNLVYVPFSEITTVESKYSLGFPVKYELNQNFPNPFNPKTTISYKLSTTDHGTLKVFDVLGRDVTTLVNEEQPTGSYAEKWDAKSVSSGIYFYQLITGVAMITKKMLLIR
jgi:hypothetical protein